MPRNTNADIAAIAQEIKRYLDTHPNAADSLDGIVQWWLPRQRYGDAIEKVKKAMDRLVQTGDVEVELGIGGKHYYKLAHKK